MGKLSNHTRQPIKRSIDIGSRDKKKLDLSDRLPRGWTVEIKSRKSGPKVGHKYKCYIAPSTGCKFYSKQEVSRYLKNRERSKGHVKVQRNDEVNGLPPGWIQEIKIRKSENGIRKDPYYTDPVSGYIFRSKRDVLRYIESGEVGKHAIKPKVEGVKNVESSELAATKRRKINGTGQSSNSNETVKDEHSKLNETVKDEEILESLETVKDEQILEDVMPLSQRASDQRGEGTDMTSLEPIKAESSKKRRGKKVHAAKRLVSSPPAVMLPPDKQQLENGVEKHGNRKTHLGSSKQKHKKVFDSPRRTSKRLAGLDAELETELGATNQTQRGTAVQPSVPEAGVAMDFTASSSKVHHAIEEQLNQLDFTASNSKAHHAIEEQLNQLESEPEANTTLHSSEPTENPLESEKPCGKQTNKLEMPLGDQANLGNIETEEKADQKPEAPLILPFGDAWPDPCLEFAFKTLTGAIPVEDNLAVHNYFQLQPSSVQINDTSEFTLPGFGNDGFCQTDDIFQFDSLMNPSYPPQLQEKPSIPPPSGNESVLSFGEKMLQPPPNGEGKKDY